MAESPMLVERAAERRAVLTLNRLEAMNAPSASLHQTLAEAVGGGNKTRAGRGR